jgi:hypothetical protein
MTHKINENDGRFPEDSPVLIWYPLLGADDSDRDTWAWLPGSILEQCGPDEWRVVVEVPALAYPDPSVPNGNAPEHMLYPACFRDSSEIRGVTVRQWEQAREDWTHG